MHTRQDDIKQKTLNMIFMYQYLYIYIYIYHLLGYAIKMIPKKGEKLSFSKVAFQHVETIKQKCVSHSLLC